MTQPSTREKLRATLRKEAAAAGFDAVAFTTADLPAEVGDNLQTFIANGHHGTMDWLAKTFERRAHPRTLWSEARSVIVLAMNYGPDHNPLDILHQRERGAISVYARNRDYHDVMKGRLKTLAAKLLSRATELGETGEVKVFVDTAPVMEKPLAQQAGLGWQGKHTNLVSRELGSWFFLGSIFTTLDLGEDKPEEDHCGTCHNCLDICPTKAFPAPYQINASRCISYLTIEHKGPIPHQFRKPMGNRIYGCDDCLAVCPWNKFANSATEAKLATQVVEKDDRLSAFLALDDAAFRALFSGSPVKRIGRDRFIRNCLIAAGNTEDQQFSKHVEQHLSDPDPLVRGAAVWALGELVPDAMQRYAKHREMERDEQVLDEWAMVEKR
ncbi:tRNA epoxyqueuosine(34) reductase QueG [Pseudahrensia aquimaris]|uniref:Epoxyqueuosine reductase n=1 Tax=Pseudahrensia aquimaris TaxID=744461 RepID=A0ABW3FEJ3_9HYPH